MECCDDFQVLRGQSKQVQLKRSLPTGYGYDYGVHVEKHHGYTIIAHSGGIKGVSSDFLVFPDLGLSVVALVNIAGVNVSDYERPF
ncbi:hypothetical protein PU629_15075 [Pullulanibacillus sp. KACC 23026]|uniref:hypothetical protein n=1 Tax=Pullulanibacillus sp. KACC 23026 TaxID=3028315 RepID=UPI0023B13D0E|nr:hypothetical protein [Pullulanibacillus sp. KACC 23026]WEG11470.1 hypothetical protein PU629_15075 [Pullulanibacillus sp. KACC 23026]